MIPFLGAFFVILNFKFHAFISWVISLLVISYKNKNKPFFWNENFNVINWREKKDKKN